MGVCDAHVFGDIFVNFDCDSILPTPPTSDALCGVTADVLLSENTDRQYELTPVKSTTLSLTTKPKLTSGRYFTPMLSIIGRRNAVAGQLSPLERLQESDLAGRNDVESAK
jgi:hypothetical protein